MKQQPVFTITYWGVTGTIATPLLPREMTDRVVRAVVRLAQQDLLADLHPGLGLDDLLDKVRARVKELPFYLRSSFGGNTTCVEVQTPDALLILDCGTGFRTLGTVLQRRWDAPGYTGPRTAHVLVTHPHADHTCATPFVTPYFDPRNDFTLWGSRSVLDSLSAVLSPTSPLSGTYFPPTYDLMKALKDFREVTPGTTFSIGSTQVSTCALHHPGGCLAYRLENRGRVFVFATDHEQTAVPDPTLTTFAHQASLLYTDAQYLQAEYEGREPVPKDPVRPRIGWGHSTVEACVVTAVAARVHRLHLGHREPLRSDWRLARIESYARRLLRGELRKANRDETSCRMRIPYEGLRVRF